ncbi:hypothetical protein F4819DRAFT_505741 [Hypoxylon fuscum]|nr:hypothetical protein F4819DRAFT_505741 [Hypoxylon fuscum]
MTRKGPNNEKSCVPCANAKRRCEPQTPSCDRCSRRGINCYYKNQPVKHLIGQISSPDDLTPVAQSGNIAPRSVEGTVPWSREMVEKIESFSTQEALPLHARKIRMLGFHSDCPMVVTLDKWSLDTLTRNVLSWPEKFLRKLEAPFIHLSIHDAPSLPLPLEEAFTVCAAYASRTVDTKNTVMNIIERKVNQLLSLDLSSMSIEAHLASLQALLILHTVQLWDGDIRQRATAETHSYVLESWALELHMRVAEASRKRDDVSTTWDLWITFESARRTAIMAMMAQGIYEMHKYGVCSYVPNMAEMPFTTIDGPWNAQTLSEWEEETRSLKESAITNYIDYADSWKGSANGSPSAFGKLLLMPCLGSGHCTSEIDRSIA